MPLLTAKEPFRFFTRLHLTELTGLRAATLGQLADLIKTVPGASIYHHTHRSLQQHQYLSPEPPNDFAYWVSEALGEDELAERLASIDTVSFVHISELREEIAATVERYLETSPLAKLKFARQGQEFHFMKTTSFVLPTNYTADNLKEFAEALKKITIDSIYFHVFEARLRLEKGTNDFSFWVGTCLEDKQLADEISRLDPYTFTMEELREELVWLVQRRVV